MDFVTLPNGRVVADNHNSLTAGKYGPLLLQDTLYFERIANFDRERIPNRVVHANGTTVFGYLEITNDITQYCKASIFSEVGKRTPCAVRFSTVIGENGTPDTWRDPRGFAMKFYTEDGNWDLVCNNTPVFFVRDPLKFIDFIHSQKRNPQTGVYDADSYWDFLSLNPTSVHQVTIQFTNRGTPFTYRHMHGFGSHTFKLLNDKGEAFWVKFHFISNTGIKNFTDEEAREMAKLDPDFHRNDIFQFIDNGGQPSWTFKIQVMPEHDALTYKWNIFDVTKVWPHADYPMITVGKLVLNRNPINNFAENEQIAFNPGSLIPGIEPSLDKMLQGRLISYTDTQRHRLGKNFMQIPVNCPYRAKGVDMNQDGFTNTGENGGDRPNYEPNSFHPYKFSEEGREHAYMIDGLVFRHSQEDHPNDDFEQPCTLYSKIISDIEREHLVKNLSIHMKYAKKFIQERQVRVFTKTHPEYGKRVAEELFHNIVDPLF